MISPEREPFLEILPRLFGPPENRNEEEQQEDEEENLSSAHNLLRLSQTPMPTRKRTRGIKTTPRKKTKFP